MTRAPYPTDLTDTEWAVLAPLIPPALAGGRPRDVDLREIVNAALYRQGSGCSWRLLPHEFPPWQTVYTYVRRWQRDGTWARILAALGDRVVRRAPDNGQAGDGTALRPPASQGRAGDGSATDSMFMLGRS